MLIGVPKEMHHDDHRVTVSPQTAERLLKLGHTVLAEASTGGMANITSDAFPEAGAKVVTDGRGFMTTGYAGVCNPLFL
jgi:NAD(P) transhydrogenase subunit alpha